MDETTTETTTVRITKLIVHVKEKSVFENGKHKRKGRITQNRKDNIRKE